MPMNFSTKSVAVGSALVGGVLGASQSRQQSSDGMNFIIPPSDGKGPQTVCVIKNPSDVWWYQHPGLSVAKDYAIGGLILVVALVAFVVWVRD